MVLLPWPCAFISCLLLLSIEFSSLDVLLFGCFVATRGMLRNLSMLEIGLLDLHAD